MLAMGRNPELSPQVTERATSIIGGKEYESVYYGHWS